MPNEESAGYSGTPLVKKLGVKPGFRVKVRNEPENYGELLGALPDGVVISRNVRGNVDLWHLFTASEKELHQVLVKAKREIQQAGMIWVSWPKKSSGVASEITEDTIRDHRAWHLRSLKIRSVIMRSRSGWWM